MTTTNKATALNALTLPLQGVRLIEASAGTGKTYTIANLFLRALLGHDEHAQGVTVDQILVVTFTDAATEELRGRIRARIHGAREDFKRGTSKDDFIQQLIDDSNYPSKDQQLLTLAEQQMDEAAIFTIHGFCQRMLKQHAFESKTLFTSELVKDTSPLLLLCAQDYWRRAFYPQSKPLAQLILTTFKSPESLLAGLRSYIGLFDLHLLDQQLPEDLDAFSEQHLAPLLKLKATWKQDRAALYDLISNAGMKKNAKPLTRLPQMDAFLDSDGLLPPEGWELYSSGNVERAMLKGRPAPNHAIFRAIDAYLDSAVDIKATLRGVVLKAALHDIRRQLAQMQAERHQFSFDDLLSQLGNALFSDDASAQQLARAIAKQYPIAMIDEFQDTDPLQYRIFSSIYLPDGQPSSDTALLMIGDPKQAIYAFRGADIFTYMQARDQVSDHYTLDTNWRSTAPMINSVNGLFENATAPFIYDSSIPFLPVKPSPKANDKRLLLYNEQLPAMTFWLQNDLSSTIGSGTYRSLMAEATACEINRLLTASDNGQCALKSDKGSSPLQPADIAVLVRDRNQAAAVRKALDSQNIASIYLSNRDSVFSATTAQDLSQLLQACLQPNDERLVRAALACPLLQLDAATLDQLNHDEHAWETAAEAFSHYHQLWLNKGVLPMLRQLIFDHRIAEQLLSFSDGERRLTDLLHLAELLATASYEQQGPAALMRWYLEQLSEPSDQADNQQLQLESERNLVKICTIHKSKGLEYNVVFLPFPCVAPAQKSALFHDAVDHKTQLALVPSDEDYAAADEERLAEDLRILYVALTRSVHSCYVGMAPFKSGRPSDKECDLHKTAIGYLLAGRNPFHGSQLPELLQPLLNDDVVLCTPPEWDGVSYQPPEPVAEALAAQPFTGQIERNWWITSYSALSRHHDNSDASIQSFTVDDDEQAVLVAANEQPDDPWSLFNFPKGAAAGTFMHTLFEELDMNALRAGCDDSYLHSFVAEQLMLHGYDAQWQAAIVALLQNNLHAPLDGDQLTLLSLLDHQRRVEMEFYLPIESLNAPALNQLISKHDLLSAQAGQLHFHQLKGMLKGFIDLTFVHDGKWYVLDYKSNWLGDNASHYNQSAMQRTMIDHRYDLQYQLYSLALHRLLQQRLPGYQFDQHFGGAIYLFLRGVQPGDALKHGIFHHRPSETFITELDQLFGGQTLC